MGRQLTRVGQSRCIFCFQKHVGQNPKRLSARSQRRGCSDRSRGRAIGSPQKSASFLPSPFPRTDPWLEGAWFWRKGIVVRSCPLHLQSGPLNCLAAGGRPFISVNAKQISSRQLCLFLDANDTGESLAFISSIKTGTEQLFS
jgi:hypothetical protein